MKQLLVNRDQTNAAYGPTGFPRWAVGILLCSMMNSKEADEGHVRMKLSKRGESALLCWPYSVSPFSPCAPPLFGPPPGSMAPHDQPAPALHSDDLHIGDLLVLADQRCFGP